MLKSNPPSFIATRGFTLLELLIGVSILGILMTLAVPSFTQMIRRNRLAAEVNGFVTAMSYARSEAYKRGVPVSVCAADAAQSACSGSLTWANGALVFVDYNGNGAVNTAGSPADVIIQKSAATTGGFAFTPTPSANFVTFNTFGPTQALSMKIMKAGCTSGPEKRTVSLTLTGRINLVKGNCP
jgi:type IV fimbrial biogenesis protein FimT